MWLALLRVFYLLACLTTLVNAGWMLVDPLSWYHNLPAGVPDTGPFNEHFVRDIGVVFAVCSIGFGWCALNPQRCLPVHLAITAFFVGHALVHLADLLAGRLPAHHWGMDAPSVFAPAVLMVVLIWPVSKLRK